MSELGAIYRLNLETFSHEKYPIVYQNKTYYYCKQYGTDKLKELSRSGLYFGPIDLDTFERRISDPNCAFTSRNHVYIVVNKNEKKRFEEVLGDAKKASKYQSNLLNKQKDAVHDKLLSKIREKEVVDKEIERLKSKLNDLDSRIEKAKVFEP